MLNVETGKTTAAKVEGRGHLCNHKFETCEIVILLSARLGLAAGTSAFLLMNGQGQNVLSLVSFSIFH